MTIRTTVQIAVLAIGAALAAGCGSTTDTHATDAPTSMVAEQAPPPAMTEEEQMAAWAESIALNENHHRMARHAGTWDVETKSWMAPGEPPIEDRGTAVFTSLMGGRYVRQELNGTIMGMPYQGIGIDGYDNHKQMYVGTWIDNFGSGMGRTEGTWDEATRTYTYILTGTDPMTGSPIEMKLMIHEVSDHELVNTMYMDVPGVGESKAMEVRYTRRK